MEANDAEPHVTCPDCDGSGFFDVGDWYDSEVTCQICGGEGLITTELAESLAESDEKAIMGGGQK